MWGVLWVCFEVRGQNLQKNHISGQFNSFDTEVLHFLGSIFLILVEYLIWLVPEKQILPEIFNIFRIGFKYFVSNFIYFDTNFI